MAIGVRDRFGTCLDVRHAMVAMLQFAVLRNERVEADTLGGLAGPAEAAPRAAADVEQALAFVERVVQPEVLDEDAPVERRAGLQRSLLLAALAPISELCLAL